MNRKLVLVLAVLVAVSAVIYAADKSDNRSQDTKTQIVKIETDSRPARVGDLVTFVGSCEHKDHKVRVDVTGVDTGEASGTGSATVKARARKRGFLIAKSTCLDGDGFMSRKVKVVGKGYTEVVRLLTEDTSCVSIEASPEGPVCINESVTFTGSCACAGHTVTVNVTGVASGSASATDSVSVTVTPTEGGDLYGVATCSECDDSANVTVEVVEVTRIDVGPANSEDKTEGYVANDYYNESDLHEPPQKTLSAIATLYKDILLDEMIWSPTGAVESYVAPEHAKSATFYYKPHVSTLIRFGADCSSKSVTIYVEGVNLKTSVEEAEEDNKTYNIFLNEDFEQKLNPVGDPPCYDVDHSDNSFSRDKGSELGTITFESQTHGDDQAQVKFTSGGGIKLYNNGTLVSFDIWMFVTSVGTLRVEGTSKGETTLTATLKTQDNYECSDTIKIKVVRLNVDLVTITPKGGKDENEICTTDVGVWHNLDDDNGNKIQDYKEVNPSPAQNDDDLFAIRIDKPNATADEVQNDAVLVSHSGRMRLYETTDKSQLAANSYKIADLPKTLYIEGTKPSYALLRHYVRVSMILDSNVSCEDEVKFTVFRLRLTKCPQGWVPVAKSTTQRGNTVDFTATLDPSVKADYIAFDLDSSNEPGICLNSPAIGALSPDLKFEQALNSSLDYVTDTHAVKNDASTAKVMVSCFDYGAWGSITAKAAIGRFGVFYDNLRAIIVEKDNDIKEHAAIPLDENNPRNYIPDWQGWDKDAHGSAGDHDNDEDPKHQARNGDGLSRYEEWRGVFVQGSHSRTDIGKKDLFVFDEDGLCRSSYFEAASDLVVHYIRATEMSGVGGGPANRRLNFNRKTFRVGGLHQYALHVVDSGRGTPDRMGFWGWSHGLGPRWADPAVEIFGDRLREDARDIVIDGGANPDSIMGKLRLRGLLTRLLRRTTAHESGHGVRVRHHDPDEYGGSRRCLMRYIYGDIHLFESSARLDPFLTRNIRPWPTTFCGRRAPDNSYGQINPRDP